MIEPFDVKDIFIVAARLKRLNDAKAFMGSAAFRSDFVTLLELIDKLKNQNENVEKSYKR